MKCNSAYLAMHEVIEEIQIECMNLVEEKAGGHSEKKRGNYLYYIIIV